MSPAVSAHDRPRPAQPVRWCTAGAPPPRPAYNGAELAYPGLSRRLWWRLFCLLWWRGLIADPCARRMARHLAGCADERGRVTELPDVIRSYLARHHLRSAQTAWTDLARLIDRGLVRQLQASAPGYPARYQLCFPADAIPGHLPADLAAALRHAARLLPAEAAQKQHTDPSAQEVPAPESDAVCGGLDPSPFFRKGSPLPPARPMPSRADWPLWHNPRGISDKETHDALSLLSACNREWRLQRGRDPVFAATDRDRLAATTALALRQLPPGEVRQLLTWQVRSARDLAGVLAWRLARACNAARQPVREVPADEKGDRYAALVAARYAAYAGRTPATRSAIAAARAALDAARARGPRCGPIRPALVTALPPSEEDVPAGPLVSHERKALL